MKTFLPIVAIGLFASSLLPAQTKRDGIVIPPSASHPFLYWNSARKSTAAAWASRVGYVPLTGSLKTLDATDASFACYVLNNSGACKAVIAWATSKPLGNCPRTDDDLRWFGGEVAEMYDWTYSSLTPVQRSSVNQAWASCQLQQDSNLSDWGLYGAGTTNSMPTNNYFNGDLRNDIEFGISMQYDNPDAAGKLLETGIGGVGGPANASRINALEDFAKPGGAGYAFPFTEGQGEYGRYDDYYAAIWIPTLHLLGRDINQETTAYKASVLVNIYNTIYNTTYRGCHEYINFGDDARWSEGCGLGGTSHNGYANYKSWTKGGGGKLMGAQYYGDFMQMMVNEESQTNIGKYARQWLNTVQPSVSPVFASLDPNPAPLSFSTLPLDYCGYEGVCWSNASDWYTTESERAWFAGNTMHLGGASHAHLEMGNFQVWRKGIPLVRETIGYAQKVAGYGGQNLVPVSSAFAHNVLLFNHHGSTAVDQAHAWVGVARILRRETQLGYFYEASDLTATYNMAGNSSSNSAASNYVREFFNFRNIPAILTVDRATATSPSTPITYLGHCETKPTVTTSGAYTYADCIDKGEQARWTFLRPAHPVITIVDESANGATCQVCQFRIEAENGNPGNALSYFVVLVQVGDSAKFAALSPTLTDSQTSDPSKGTFTVNLDSQDSLVLQKGPTSNGGTITVGGKMNALTSGVAQMSITDNGPVWSAGTAATLTSVLVSPSSPKVPVGTSQQFLATCVYADNSTSNCTSSLTWASGNQNIAVAANSGSFRGVATGSTTITATNGTVTGTGTVVVTSPVVTAIQVTPSTATISAVAGSESYAALCTYSNHTTSACTSNVSWASSNQSTATIGKTGVAHGYSQGIVTISASTGDIRGTGSLTVTPGQWTLIQQGSPLSKQTGLYGTLGVAAPGNLPGGREAAATWTDSAGTLWLFGGNGVDASGKEGYLDDLWKYVPSQQDWTWVGGTNAASGPSTGKQNASGTFPSPRAASTEWIDGAGHLWLFGGDGYDTAGVKGNLNDLWEFVASSGKWTLVSGSDKVPAANEGQAGVYGAIGVAAHANRPGGRWGANSFTDSLGDLWLFGGVGNDSTGASGSLNDLWEFDPTTAEWTWVSGSKTVGTLGGQIGTYGKLEILSPANVPSGRSQSMSWSDSKGDFWVFGGYGFDSAGNRGYLNELWEFDSHSKEWRWMGGSNTIPCKECGRAGVYGTVAQPDSQNVPGGRILSVTWTDSEGNFWLFGGQGYDAAAKFGELNDLWQYNPTTQEWTWEGGQNSVATPSQSTSAGTPAARSAAAGWMTTQSGLWLFGGFNSSTSTSPNLLNDLWVYKLPKN